MFGVGMTQAMGMKPPGIGVDYNAFFLAGVLGMASFGIASNTAWSFFMDRDNGIFYEMLTYPMRRAEYLLGKGLFNLVVSIVQAIITVVLADLILDVPIRWQSLPLLSGGRLHRHRRLVLLLCDLCVDHPRQRCVQHGDVDLLLRPAVRELDVLSRSNRCPRRCASSPGQIRSPGTWMCSATRRSASANRPASGWSPRPFSPSRQPHLEALFLL